MEMFLLVLISILILWPLTIALTYPQKKWLEKVLGTEPLSLPGTGSPPERRNKENRSSSRFNSMHY